MSEFLPNFGDLKEGDKFLFTVGNRVKEFTKRKGTSYTLGPMKPVDYNAVESKSRKCHTFESDEVVVLI